MSCDKILGVASIGVAAILLGFVAFDATSLRIELSGAAASTLAANQTTPVVDLGVLDYCTDLQNGLGPQCSPTKIESEASKYINFTGATGFTVFIFDLAFFFVVGGRMGAGTGTVSAVMGSAILLTVIAMLLLL